MGSLRDWWVADPRAAYAEVRSALAEEDGSTARVARRMRTSASTMHQLIAEMGLRPEAEEARRRARDRFRVRPRAA